MVLFSTKQSLENKEVSFFAILETIVAVIIYWYIAVYYDTYLHLLFSVIITPLLLLKTKESIKYSSCLIKKYFKSYENKKIKLSYIYALFGVTFVLFNYIFFSYYESDFWYLNLLVSAMIAVYSYIIAFTFFSSKFLVRFVLNALDEPKIENDTYVNIIAEYQIGVTTGLIGILLSLGFYLRVLYIRTVSTFRYIYLSPKYFIDNWKNIVFSIDIFSPSKILPDIDSGDLEFFLNKFTNEKKQDTRYYRIAVRLIYYSYVLPSFIYRLSLKGTFWFYIPLLFLVKSPNLENSQEIGKFLSELYQTIWAWLRVLLAVISMSAFMATYFNFYAFSEVSNIPFIMMISMLYLDFSSIELWKIFQLTIAVLTIGLFLYANAIRVPAIENKIELNKDNRVMVVYYLNNLRNWFSLFYFTSAFIFLAYSFKVWEYPYMPHFMEDFLSNLIQYIQYKPFGKNEH